MYNSYYDLTLLLSYRKDMYSESICLLFHIDVVSPVQVAIGSGQDS